MRSFVRVDALMETGGGKSQRRQTSDASSVCGGCFCCGGDEIIVKAERQWLPHDSCGL